MQGMAILLLLLTLFVFNTPTNHAGLGGVKLRKIGPPILCCGR